MEEDKELTMPETQENKETTMPEAQENPETQEKKDPGSWWERSVTRKFAAAALAAAVLLNAAITAGMTGSLLKKQTEALSGTNGKGHVRSEMHVEKNRKSRGGAASPEDGQGTEQSPEQPSKVSIGILINEDSGVVVAQVTGENARKAGLREGDRIVSAEGQSVSTGSDLISAVQSHEAGDTMTLIVERDGQTLEIKTELE